MIPSNNRKRMGLCKKTIKANVSDYVPETMIDVMTNTTSWKNTGTTYGRIFVNTLMGSDMVSGPLSYELLNRFFSSGGPGYNIIKTIVDNESNFIPTKLIAPTPTIPIAPTPTPTPQSPRSIAAQGIPFPITSSSALLVPHLFEYRSNIKTYNTGIIALCIDPVYIIFKCENFTGTVDILYKGGEKDQFKMTKSLYPIMTTVKNNYQVTDQNPNCHFPATVYLVTDKECEIVQAHN